jgi:large subunit ribosomal protein L4
MKIDLFDFLVCKKIGDYDCSELSTREVKDSTLAQYLVMHEHMSHGSHRALTKNRALMTTGKKKPYAQKGSGRARHGSIVSPLHRGGAVAWGPNGKERASFTLPRKVRQKAFYGSLGMRCRDGGLKIIDNLSFDIKKDALNRHDLQGLIGRRSVLIYDECFSSDYLLKVRNLPTLNLVDFNFLNVHDILSNDNLFVTRAAFDTLAQRSKTCMV